MAQDNEPTRSGGTFALPRRIMLHTARIFAMHLLDYLATDADSIVLDFSETELTYIEGMVPLLTILDAHRPTLKDVRIILPRDPRSARYIRDRNWEHFLTDGVEARPADRGASFLPATRFETAQELFAAVNSALDVVMKSAQLSRDVFTALEWALNEIGDNVLNHSESNWGGFMEMEVLGIGELSFVVADAGRGIPSSMSSGMNAYSDDMTALGEAVKAGVTRDPNAGQGNGLAGTLRIATASRGSLEIISGGARFVMYHDQDDGEPRQRVHPFPTPYPGTAVVVRIGTADTFSLADALAFRGVPYYPDDIIDLTYTNPSDDLVLKLANESVGFGTRSAGRGVRTKIMNLLNAEPDKRLVVDCEGMPTISSSFADETFGRLFWTQGPLAFNSRIQFAHMDELIRRLVDAAIIQRIIQEAETSTVVEEQETTDELIPSADKAIDSVLSEAAKHVSSETPERALPLLKSLEPMKALPSEQRKEWCQLVARYYLELARRAHDRGALAASMSDLRLGARFVAKAFRSPSSRTTETQRTVRAMTDLGDRLLGHFSAAEGEALVELLESLRLTASNE